VNLLSSSDEKHQRSVHGVVIDFINDCKKAPVSRLARPVLFSWDMLSKYALLSARTYFNLNTWGMARYATIWGGPNCLTRMQIRPWVVTKSLSSLGF